MLTRVFKSGNSLAVRIPTELANQDVEIEKVGDILALRRVVKRKLSGLAEAFAMFTPDFMAAGREFHEQKQRDWSGFGEAAQLQQKPADYTPASSPMHYRNRV